ncbi:MULTISPECIES: hypothetical protein, partial [unclassified Variovorax]|uniref:hypothetical protein n=1 Tax=unclassified Variovorax TaxID=663243 RepID=UPI003F4739E7
ASVLSVSMSHGSVSNEKCPPDQRLEGTSRRLDADYLHSLFGGFFHGARKWHDAAHELIRRAP